MQLKVHFISCKIIFVFGADRPGIFREADLRNALKQCHKTVAKLNITLRFDSIASWLQIRCNGDGQIEIIRYKSTRETHFNNSRDSMHSHEIEANDRSHKIAPKHSPKRSDMNSMCSPNVEHNYADDNKNDNYNHNDDGK